MDKKIEIITNIKWDVIKDKLLQVAKRAKQRPYKKSKCPKVAAIVIDSRKSYLAEGAHDEIIETNPRSVCFHAEEIAIDRLMASDVKCRDLHDSIFISSLEPCSERGEQIVPCAHRISTLGFKKVYIGLMDPDPTIFGNGVFYLVQNRGQGYVDYLPKYIREALWSQNKDYIERKAEVDFSLNMIKEQLPLFCHINEPIYFRMAHAFSRRYEGDKIVWLFPKLPSFANPHIFQAWWAQGVFENKYIRTIEFYMHEEDWKEGVQDCVNNEMVSMILEETAGRPVQIYTRRHDGDCPCRYFRGALLYNGEDIDYLILTMYSNICGPLFCSLFVFEPKHLGQIIKPYAEKTEINMKDMYYKAKNKCDYRGYLHDFLKESAKNQV